MSFVEGVEMTICFFTFAPLRPFDWAQDMLGGKSSETDRCAQRTLRKLGFGYVSRRGRQVRNLVFYLRVFAPLREIFRLFACGLAALGWLG
jgi:hypothetical protein